MMSENERIQAKIYRLEELKKYQSYYGPTTPYPVIVEINDLEAEIQRLLAANKARAGRVAKKKSPKKKPSQAPFWQFWRMSSATFDAVATIAFIGLVFFLGSIVFAAYVNTRPAQRETALASINPGDPPIPTLRPTFTPTAGPNGSLLTDSETAADGSTYLPTPGEVATEVPTPVPTLTPSATPIPTEVLLPTDTPEPTPAPPVAQPVVAQPAVAAAAPAPAAVVPTEAPPPAPAAPAFPFTMVEQGNREFQRTNYHVITIYVAAISEGNIPIGGVKVVGDQSPTGMHAESALSDWGWSAVNCLDCDYIKQGNVKFEPGNFEDGVWNIYLADESGTPLSAAVPLSYSADPEKWVWDFVIFKRNS